MSVTVARTSLLRTRTSRWGMTALLVAGLATMTAGQAMAAGHGPAGHDPIARHQTAAPAQRVVPSQRVTPERIAPPQPLGWPWGDALHGQLTIQTRDAGVSTVTLQRGTVTGVDATSVTVLSTDAFSCTWIVDASTRVLRGPRDATTLPVVGDEVGVWGSGPVAAPTAGSIVVRHRPAPRPSASPTPSGTADPTPSSTPSSSPSGTPSSTPSATA